MGRLTPNTTQIPHIIIRKWMPLLKDVELRVLLVVADQTLGWQADPVTGRRKEKDWISQSQLLRRAGRGNRAVSVAVKVLADKLGIIEATDVKGNILDASQRRRNFGKIFYRLTLRLPTPTLFGEKLGKTRGKTSPRVPFVHTQERRTTKGTVNTKDNKITDDPQNAKNRQRFLRMKTSFRIGKTMKA